MSHEIRHFLVFVEQHSPLVRPVADESVALPFSSALKEHFGARAGEGSSTPAAIDHGQTPLGRGVDPGSR